MRHRVEEPQISIEEAWALVAMADRINDGKYVKFIEYAPSDDGSTSDVIAYRPNRELIRDSLEKGQPAVTNDDRRIGKEMAEHFKGLMFDALGGDQHEFDQKVLTLIQKDSVGANSGMAIMACLASRFRREINRERVVETIGKIGFSSQYKGQIGERLKLSVRILSKFAGKTFIGSVVRATDGENLYFWTSSQTVSHWPDEEFTVIGAVKNHSTDQNGHRETRLTRVKIAM